MHKYVCIYNICMYVHIHHQTAVLPELFWQYARATNISHANTYIHTYENGNHTPLLCKTTLSITVSWQILSNIEL